MKQLKFVSALVFAICLFSLSACSDDNDGPSYSNEEIEGYWELTHQQWIETIDGETDTYGSTYTPSGEYFIYFGESESGDGFMNSYGDQIMEVNGYREFTYSLSGNKINVDFESRSSEVWTIESVGDDTLTLSWIDNADWGTLKIICQFQKGEIK